MASEQKAELTGTISYSDGTKFNGWMLVGLVPPLRGSTAYSSFYKVYAQQRTKLPQWVSFQIKDGEFQSPAKLRFNTSISPPNTKYVSFFVDYEGNTLATGSLFTVTATPHAIVEPSFSLPTAGTTAPTPCQGVSVSALSTPIRETPSGTIDGVNDTFTLSVIPPSFVIVILNGTIQDEGVSYTISGNTITFEAAYIPSSGSIIEAIIF